MALGLQHPSVATSLHDLAALYYTQGQYAKAEPFFEQALAIVEKAQGAEHPDVAHALNSLALLYLAQGQYAKAEPLFERALTIREKALGAEHHDVADSLHNLAALYYTQGQYAKAEPYMSERLEFGKRRWDRSTPTWRRAWKTTHSVCEPWAVRRKPLLLKTVRGPFGLRAPDWKSRVPVPPPPGCPSSLFVSRRNRHVESRGRGLRPSQKD
jgi:tetratricopeptide (TPR) repeat protein